MSYDTNESSQLANNKKIILAMYYCMSDIVLLCQCFYYKGFTLSDKPKAKPLAATQEAAPTERSTLLPRSTASTGASGVTNLPEEDQRSSSFRNQLVQSGTQLSPTVPMHRPQRDEDTLKVGSAANGRDSRSLVKAFLFNLTAVLVVCAAGVLGWWLSTASRDPHHGTPRQPRRHRGIDAIEFDVLGQVFGYICAALYLGSRAPQLLLNYRRQSTEGISMLFFLFACIGNATYVASILAYSPVCNHPGHCERGEAMSIYWRYILVNLSWLIGSFGTLLLDGCVFVQHFMYRGNVPSDGDETAIE